MLIMLSQSMQSKETEEHKVTSKLIQLTGCGCDKGRMGHVASSHVETTCIPMCISQQRIAFLGFVLVMWAFRQPQIARNKNSLQILEGGKKNKIKQTKRWRGKNNTHKKQPSRGLQVHRKSQAFKVMTNVRYLAIPVVSIGKNRGRFHATDSTHTAPAIDCGGWCIT